MRTKASVTVLYHADCLDGFGAAYAAWRHFGDDAHYRPMHHGDAWEMTDIAGHDVYILDFSFPPDVLHTLAAVANSVTQIDHHASARQHWAACLESVANGLSTFQDQECPLTVIFDLEKSGARLSWEHFQPGLPPPLAVLHVEDLDMWRFALPGTRAFCRALRLQGFDFAIWDKLSTEANTTESPRYREMLAIGEAIEVFFQKEVRRLAAGHLARPARLRGEPVDALQAMRHGQATVSDGDRAWLAIDGIAINANVLFASELGNLLAEQSGSYGLIWQLSGDGEVKASLRAKGAVDVAAIASRYGGGGHPNAAGFRLPQKQFMSEVLDLD